MSSTPSECEYRNSGASPAERRLARAVILRGLADYGHPSSSAIRNEVADWLFGSDTRDAAFWCELADVPLADIRASAHDRSRDDHMRALHGILANLAANRSDAVAPEAA